MYSRDFVDSKEDKNTDEGLVNLHNNEAGRRVRLFNFTKIIVKNMILVSNPCILY